MRKRWHRTPPVARPFAGYSANGVTFADPVWVPGSASDPPLIVTTLAPHSPSDRVRSTAPKNTALAVAVRLTPAIPPAERPCGRTLSAPNRNSWASLLMNTRSQSALVSSTAPTTSSPSLSAITSHESRFAG